jgi:amino acid efflux transporter
VAAAGPADDPAAVAADRLSGHLRLPGAVALAVTIVVGSGVLVLPGIAYREVGRSALLAWIITALVSIPLLLVFSRLGARYPGAGGVAGFVQAAFGRHTAAGVEVMLLGTFGLGIPGIALTGGNYLTTLLPGSASSSLAAIALVVLAAVVVAAGVRLSTRVQIALSLFFTIALLAIGAAGVSLGSPIAHGPTLTGSSLLDGVSAIGIVFFAFTGWEMLSFTTEEYVNPKRDFPRAVAISYVVVVSMYVLLAWAVQTQLPDAGHADTSAPVYALVQTFVGAGVANLTSVLAVVIIAANLIGATWGASRLVLASAREGLLPRALARFDAGSSTPRLSVVACCTGFVAVLLVNAAGALSLRGLLSIAGENFFILYLLCALAYARLFPGPRRIFGLVVALALAAVAAATFHPGQLGYAAGLLLLGAGVSRLRRRRAAVSGS